MATNAEAGALPVARRSPGHRRAIRRAERRDSWARRLPLMPAIAFVAIVSVVPVLFSLWYSLTEWTIVPPSPRRWIGVGNYAEALSNGLFREAVWVSLLMTVSAVLLSLFLGTLAAVLLDHAFLGRGLARTLMITPFLVMPVVGGLIWRDQMLSAAFGALNWGLEGLGSERIEFVSRYPLWSIVAVLVWQWTPFMMLIMLAGLQSQPTEVLEAARVDGARSHSIFFQITLPHLMPYFQLGILLGAIYLIQVYDHIDVITGGGPDSTNVPFFILERSLGGGWDFGQASAYAIVVVVGSIVLATMFMRLLGRLLAGEEAAR